MIRATTTGDENHRGAGFRFRVSGFRFQVSGLRFQVSGLRLVKTSHLIIPETDGSSRFALFFLLRQSP